MNTSPSTADRELSITRLLNAPRELVFEVWTDPEHIKHWWGPNGFTITTHKMEVRPGGEWDSTMHGPDSTDYKNKSVFIEIIKPRLLVYKHVTGPKFVTTVTFEEEGKKTRLTMTMVFDSTDERNSAIKVFGADEGLKQTIARLGQYVETAKSITR